VGAGGALSGFFGGVSCGSRCGVSDVTRILERAQQGDARAASKLLTVVYDELRRLAALKMAGQPAGHTLQPTALVHEAYLRLIGAGQGQPSTPP